MLVSVYGAVGVTQVPHMRQRGPDLNFFDVVSGIWKNLRNPFQHTLGTPVFFFLEPDGKEILKIYGFQDARQLLEMDRYIQGGNYANVSFKDFKRTH